MIGNPLVRKPPIFVSFSIPDFLILYFPLRKNRVIPYYKPYNAIQNRWIFDPDLIYFCIWSSPRCSARSGDALLSGRRQDMDNDFSRILSDPGILSAVFLADERRQLNSGPALWLLKSPVVFPCWISVLAQDSQSIRNHIRILYSLILRNYGIVKSGIMNFRGWFCDT